MGPVRTQLQSILSQKEQIKQLTVTINSVYLMFYSHSDCKIVHCTMFVLNLSTSKNEKK